MRIRIRNPARRKTDKEKGRKKDKEITVYMDRKAKENEKKEKKDNVRNNKNNQDPFFQIIQEPRKKRLHQGFPEVAMMTFSTIAIVCAGQFSISNPPESGYGSGSE
jgi:hypothetical protein